MGDVADLVGMRAPSLYSHFESKNAIYDAMFADAWNECLAVMSAAAADPPRSPRAAMQLMARTFFDFAIDAQLANDPGGDRWSRLLDRAIDMLADNLGIRP